MSFPDSKSLVDSIKEELPVSFSEGGQFQWKLEVGERETFHAAIQKVRDQG